MQKVDYETRFTLQGRVWEVWTHFKGVWTCKAGDDYIHLPSEQIELIMAEDPLIETNQDLDGYHDEWRVTRNGQFKGYVDLEFGEYKTDIPRRPKTVHKTLADAVEEIANS